jgi:hypothetical protein
MSSYWTFIGVPVSSRHERYVWGNVGQPSSPNFPAAVVRDARMSSDRASA